MDEIQKLLDNMHKEIRLIKKNAVAMSWYTRGGLSYQEVLNTSSEEREIISEVINDNLETTKKSQMPFF
jgi:hypothetical protein